MYHLSGISSLTRSGPSRTNSLSDVPSTPLSPSVLDFSEYVSRQCEKKLQRRVRQLTAKSNRQLATISKLRRQLVAQRTPLHDVSNTRTTAPPSDRRTSFPLKATVTEGEVEAALPAGSDTGLERERDDEIEAEPSEESTGEDDTADRSEQSDADDSLLPRQEGQLRDSATAAATADGACVCISSAPCSPIPVARHKRGRTDDSEQCDTELLDAQWKRSKEEDEEEAEERADEAALTAVPGVRSDDTEHSSTGSAPAGLPVGSTRAQFKSALLHPFLTSHAQLQSHSSGGSLTPYRGLLLRPFPLVVNHSPARIAQLQL